MKFMEGIRGKSILWGISSLIGSLIMVIQPQIIKKIFDGCENKSYVWNLVLLYGFSILLILLSEYTNKYLLIKIHAGIKKNILEVMVESISTEDYTPVSEYDVAEMNVDINTNIDEVIEGYYINILNLIFIGISLLFYSITIWSMDMGMVWFIVLPNVFALFIPKILKRNISNKKTRRINASEKYNLLFFDYYRGNNILKNLLVVKRWKNRLSISMQSFLKKELKYEMSQSLGEILIGGISYIGVFGMIAYGLQAIYNNKITLGVLVAALQYSDMISVPIINFSVGLNMLSAGRLLNLHFKNRYSRKYWVKGKKQKSEKFQSININNLEFCYEEETNLFHFSELNIKNGDKILLIGKNGTGKSSFIKILLRILTVYKGEIKINNKNINEYSFSDISSFISYVPQNNYLFEGSIEENIKLLREESWGKPQYEILDFTGVRHLLESNLDVNSLSGGEKQRISLARALVCYKDILIIDEGLNEIEETSRIKILENLLANKNLTLIYISHDKSDYLNGFNKKIEFGR